MTSQTRKFIDGGRMACPACCAMVPEHILATSVWMCPNKSGWQPGGSGMALGAIRSKRARVEGRLTMTGGAIGWRSFVLS
jgi:hypothetical protein